MDQGAAVLGIAFSLATIVLVVIQFRCVVISGCDKMILIHAKVESQGDQRNPGFQMTHCSMQ